MGNRSIDQYLAVAAQLDEENGWNLTDSELEEHANEAHATLNAIGAEPSLIRMRTVLANYHHDHALVAALRDADNAEHAHQWTEWSRQAMRILLSRSRTTFGGDTTAVSLEDLTQEAMVDLWNALASYRYESRFQTWAFTVISNCYLRAQREIRAVKRTVNARAVSLDQLTEQLGTSPLPALDSTDEAVFDRLLAQLLQEVLEQHPDGRLSVVFSMWLHEDQPLRVLGERLRLSIPRIHALLSQALTLLRSEERVRTWQYE